MAKIRRINHWMLGEARVWPFVGVENTHFKTWLPDEQGRYSMQALHYSMMHPKVMCEDADLSDEPAYTSQPAHDRSLLRTYEWAERASRLSVIDAQGNLYPPIDVKEAEGLDYNALNLRINTATLRATTTEFYLSAGSVSLRWIDEPPLIPLPLNDRYLLPDGMSKQDPSLLHDIPQWLIEG